MTHEQVIAVLLLLLLIIPPALVGLLWDRAQTRRSRLERLLTADHAIASERLRYYNEVHDSHSG